MRPVKRQHPDPHHRHRKGLEQVAAVGAFDLPAGSVPPAAVSRHSHGARRAARHEVLQLDVSGLPQDWITVEDAAGHLANGSVAWYAGDEPLAVLRGGMSAATGRQSILEVPPIVALRGKSRINLHDVSPALTNAKLLVRDRMTCAYCGGVFHPKLLTREHIIPTSRGGTDTWMNVVTADRGCNGTKGNRLLSEIGWELLYAPYVPSLYEDLLLRGRNVRADVHEWLASKLPKGSRLS